MLARMTRATRIALGAAVAVAAIAMTVSPPSSARQEPVRSGTIAGWGATWVAMSNGAAKDCEWSDWNGPGNPECLAWLRSGCDPALAGRNPAVTASIENVADLADGTTPRKFDWRAFSYPGWSTGGGVMIQLWRKDCTEIRSSKWLSVEWNEANEWTNRPTTTFRIPREAEWMTVTTNDTANLEWELN